MHPLNLNPEPARYRNPEGNQEFLKPGDILVAQTEMSIYSFVLPGRDSGSGGPGEVKSLVDVGEGDYIQYLGLKYHGRSGGIFKPVPVYAFKLMRLGSSGQVVKEVTFYIKNVESLLKWTDRLEEE